ncbi:nitrogen fixation protein NifZ [Alteraurantiacibacter aquimixticola]|uniref:Nitrogen fixation protein NifZ n=1 Tax=Alteraurantiacibacter aquimixticola TaxID=2489173 RepID=A0A4T3F386_9SPHN|nr:nitrogen fixation protein NifZ [Alteraurantiacibacter aquimixticola]TIX51618.1 nitrogen fixation protein NifZ [Alteraurantiacibacter aquimixticola]
MTNIVRDSEVVELNNPPAFRYGERVRAKRTVRNDGTYAGKEIGDILVKKHEEGVVVSIGTFLQQFYIYGIEFFETGNRVGMKRRELEPLDLGCEEEDELPSTLPRRVGGRR